MSADAIEKILTTYVNCSARRRVMFTYRRLVPHLSGGALCPLKNNAFIERFSHFGEKIHCRKAARFPFPFHAAKRMGNLPRSGPAWCADNTDTGRCGTFPADLLSFTLPPLSRAGLSMPANPAVGFRGELRPRQCMLTVQFLSQVCFKLEVSRRFRRYAAGLQSKSLVIARLFRVWAKLVEASATRTQSRIHPPREDTPMPYTHR